MIEVLALAGAVKAVSGAISAAVKAGQDASSLMPEFGKLAKLDAEIRMAESGGHKGFLGKLTSSEEEGFAIAQAKLAHRQAVDELRSVCQLYGPPDMWTTVLREQAAARVRHANALKAEADKRNKIMWFISMAFGAVLFFALSGLVILGASTLNK
jgi:hypothetical protein|tara:strand:+ start:204 stop:668 length:465 start_codon:yes stop_codon:yes gene_type:complete